jgi:hypothetical protein
VAGDDVEIQWWLYNAGDFRSNSAKLICTEENLATGKKTIYLTVNVTGLEINEDVKIPSTWNTTSKSGSYQLHGELADVEPVDANSSNDRTQIPISVREKNEIPIAILDASPLKGGIGSIVTFNASKSSDDLSIAQYRFYFDDGAESGWIAEPVTTHQYLIAGEYDAYVVVEDYDQAISDYNDPGAHRLISINESIPVNHAPVINKVDYQPQKVAPDGTVKINVDAVDEDGDELTYVYSAAVGTISGSGPEVRWYAPQEEGEYSIIIHVSDGIVDSDSFEITITVSKDAPSNLPPVLNSLIVTPTVIGLNGDASVTVDAYDPEGNNLLYVYSVTGGSISGSGPSVRYISPGKEGMYQLSVFVSDGELDSLTATTTIEVFENDPPELSAIVADPEVVSAGASATIKVIANDPDGDELSFTYLPEAGTITGSGSTVVWTAPMDIGEYEITVIVTDPLGLSVEDSVKIEVIFPGDGPQILDFELLPNIVGNDGVAEVVVTVELVHPLGLNHIESVFIDLSDVGGKSLQELYDSGRHGDEERKDGIYTYKFGIPLGTEPGDYALYVSVEDTEGKLAGTNLMLEVIDTKDSEPSIEAGFTRTEQIIMVAITAVVIITAVFFAFFFFKPKKPVLNNQGIYSDNT